MPEENTTPPVSQDSTADSQSTSQAEAPTAVQQPAAETSSAAQPTKSAVGISFTEKIELTKKKYEYINGKGMDAIAAEEAARKDLDLPPMNETEKGEATKPNIFQRILNSKLFTTLGITALLSPKKEDSETELKDEVNEKSEAESEKVEAEVVSPSSAPEVTPDVQSAPASQVPVTPEAPKVQEPEQAVPSADQVSQAPTPQAPEQTAPSVEQTTQTFTQAVPPAVEAPQTSEQATPNADQSPQSPVQK